MAKKALICGSVAFDTIMVFGDRFKNHILADKITGTRDLRNEVERAEVVVVAVGRTGVIPGEWVRPGAAVFDVGINRTVAGKLAGDVEYDSAARRAGWIAPVPGGIGPMTIAMLLSNVVAAALARAGGKT